MMTDREYREQADSLLILMQTDAISYQEYTRRQRKLVDAFYSMRADGKRKQICTCLGVCKGEDGLGDGWMCALKLNYINFQLRNNA